MFMYLVGFAIYSRVRNTGVHTYEGSTSSPALRCLGHRNLNSYREKEKLARRPGTSRESETARERGTQHTTRTDTEEEEEWWRTRSGRRWRGLRLEGSCAEDEEISEEDEGAQWHGTYEYPRHLQRWEREAATVEKSIAMGTSTWSSCYSTLVYRKHVIIKLKNSLMNIYFYV